MVSANIPEQWLSNVSILRLSYRARDHHTMLLTWSVSNRTNGLVPKDIDLFQPTITSEGLTELTESGLLEDQGKDFLLTKYEESQSSAAQIDAGVLAARRNSDKLRKRRQRANEKEVGKKNSNPPVSHVTVTGQAERTEKQNTGKQSSLDQEEASTRTDPHSYSWPVAPIPEYDPELGEVAEVSPLKISETIYTGSFENLPTDNDLRSA